MRGAGWAGAVGSLRMFGWLERFFGVLLLMPHGLLDTFLFLWGGSPRSSYNPRVKEKQQTKRSVYITMQSRIVIMKLACFVCFACFVFCCMV